MHYKLNDRVRELDFEEFTVLAKLDPAAPGWIKIGREALPWVRMCAATPVDAVTRKLPNEERENFVKLLAHLLKKGYLESVDESVSPSGASGPPTNAPTPERAKGQSKATYYSVSEGCNLACRHCYLAPPLARERRQGNLEDSRRILAGLAEYGVGTVVLTGGEPLLRLDIVDIVRAAKAIGMRTVLTTNGTLLDSELAVQLREAEVDDVSISIEGTTAAIHDRLRGVGAFDRSKAAVEHLKKAGFDGSHINLCATITRDNYQNLRDIRSFARSMGVSHSFSLFQPVGRGGRNAKSLILGQAEFHDFLLSTAQAARDESSSHAAERVDPDLWTRAAEKARDPQPLKLNLRNTCGMGRTIFGVKENGDVVPCHLFLGSEDHAMGNLLRESLSIIAERHSKSWLCIDDIATCRSCNVRYFCGGCCSAGTYWSTGTFDAPSPYCGALKVMYTDVLSAAGARRQDGKVMTSLDCPR